MKAPGIYDMFREIFESHAAVWLYSDPHFGESDIEAGVPGRPSAEAQLSKINSQLGAKDVFICLGDCGDTSYIQRIRAGYKICIMGNHDGGKTNYQRQTVTKYYDAEKYTEEEAFKLFKAEYPNCYYVKLGEHHDFHSPFVTWGFFADNQLFDLVFEGPVMIAEKLILSHEPVSVPWAYNVHGHVHSGFNTAETVKTHYNVCSDVIDYKPVPLSTILKIGIGRNIQSLHRQTIDHATARSTRRKKKEKKI